MHASHYVTSRDSREALWIFQDLVEIKVSGKQTGGAYCLLEDWPAPSYAPLLHIHRAEDEIVTILDGEFAFVTETGQTEAKAGDVVRIPKGTPHAFRNLRDTPGRRLVLFVPAGPDRLWEEVGTPAFDRTTPPPDPTDVSAFLAAAQRYGLEVVGVTTPGE
jgi:mannose-6-phosphate isomerase-like protein (cupin superfamily)